MRKRAAKPASGPTHRTSRSPREAIESELRSVRAEHRRRTLTGGVRRPLRTRLEVRYTRKEWINKLAEVLVNAGYAFHMARMETAHGRPSNGAHWMIECRSTLSFGSVRLLTDVTRRFDRNEACRQAIRNLAAWRKAGRFAAETLFYRAYGQIEHALTDRDTRDFFLFAVQQLDLVLNYAVLK
jgi:hypothetical protein